MTHEPPEGRATMSSNQLDPRSMADVQTVSNFAAPGSPEWEHQYTLRQSAWVAWVNFAGLMLVLVGFFHGIQGLVALFREEVYVVGRRGLVLDVGFTTWGWAHLVWGVVAILPGYSLRAGRVGGESPRSPERDPFPILPAAARRGRPRLPRTSPRDVGDACVTVVAAEAGSRPPTPRSPRTPVPCTRDRTCGARYCSGASVPALAPAAGPGSLRLRRSGAAGPADQPRGSAVPTERPPSVSLRKEA